MKWIPLAMMISLPGSLLAQQQTNDTNPPRGFTIRLAPSEKEGAKKSDPLLAPDKKKTAKDQGKEGAKGGGTGEGQLDAQDGVEGSTDEAGTSPEAGSASATVSDEETTRKSAEKEETSKRARRKKKGHRTKKRERAAVPAVQDAPLEGTGAPFGRTTDYGRLETIPPRVVARIQATTGGQEAVHERSISFEPGRYALEPRQKIVLAAISDFLEVSPKIGLVMVEGIGSELETTPQNQMLGEARASAVREFIVHQGIDGKRILAYGLAGQRRGDESSGAERIVKLRMLSFGEIEAEPATEWNQVAIAGIWGGGEWRKNHRQTVPAAMGDWMALRIRDQLPHDVVLRSSERGRVLLRFPDASRILLEGGAMLRLDTLRYDSAEGLAQAVMRLDQGIAHVHCSPATEREADVSLLFPGGAISTRSSRFVLAINVRGEGRLTVEEGTLNLAMTGSRPLTLGAGQTMLVGPRGPLALPQMARPSIVAPKRGNTEGPVVFRWRTVPGATGYLLEVSRDIDFYDLAARALVQGVEHQIDALQPGAAYYWRLIPMDKHNAPGQTSQIYRFQVLRP